MYEAQLSAHGRTRLKEGSLAWLREECYACVYVADEIKIAFFWKKEKPHIAVALKVYSVKREG